MAFETTVRAQNDQVCPMCRKLMKSYKKINISAYRKHGTMCNACFKHLYKNFSDNRMVGFIDDSANLIVKLLPAPILEKPLFIKREFITGYEYRMPHATEMHLIFRNLIWILVMLTINAVLGVCKYYIPHGTTEICSFGVNIVFFLGSAFIGIMDIIDLVKGFFLGMGHPRRLILIASIALLAMMIFYVLKQFI